tara:strand:- start:583 stop:1341 length:759 start_codon:yes stop_codon:yes gene_type:complete
MIIVISPAKNLNENYSLTCSFSTTKPKLLNESKKLIKTLKEFSPKKLSSLMNVSDKIANLNYERYKSWKTPFTKKNSYPAVLLFKGDVYKGLEAETFNKSQFLFAQKHLRILSGLYGLLKPLDLIQPYRLEMGTSLKVGAKNNLYEFWEDKITNQINEDTPSKYLINLASVEYFKSIDRKSLNLDVINILFKEKKNGDLKTIGLFSKKARGLMSKFIIQNKIKNPVDLKNFNDDGYKFNAKYSDDNNFLFIR